MNQLVALDQLGQRASLELPPEVPQSNIGFDLHRIGKMATIGCLNPEVQFDDRVDSTRLGNKKVPLSTYSLEKISWLDDEHNFFGHTKPRLTVHLNIEEMTRRIHDQGNDLSDPNPWAKQFKAGIGQSMRSASREHLMESGSSWGETSSYLVALGVAELIAYLADLEAWPVFWASFAFFNVSKLMEQREGRRSTAEMCYSLIPGAHLDRYAAVWGMATFSKLARPISPSAS